MDMPGMPWSENAALVNAVNTIINSWAPAALSVGIHLDQVNFTLNWQDTTGLATPIIVQWDSGLQQYTVRT